MHVLKSWAGGRGRFGRAFAAAFRARAAALRLAAASLRPAATACRRSRLLAAFRAAFARRSAAAFRFLKSVLMTHVWFSPRGFPHVRQVTVTFGRITGRRLRLLLTHS